MDKVIINSYEDFEKLVGQEIGVSDYVEVSQERINLFADAPFFLIELKLIPRPMI